MHAERSLNTLKNVKKKRNVMSLEDFETEADSPQSNMANSIYPGISSANESKEHYEEKITQAKQLQSEGFDVEVEKGFSSGFRVDVYGSKNDTEIVIEVGKNSSKKLDWLDGRFDEVRLVPYFKNGHKVEGVRSYSQVSTVAIPDQTHDIIEKLQDDLPWSPSKKGIVSKAVEEFYERKSESASEQIAEDNNNNE